MDTKWSTALYLVIDVLILVIVGLANLLINLLGQPFHRGFYCNDESIQFPLHLSIVSNEALGMEVLFLPIVVFAITEFTRKRGKRPRMQCCKLPTVVTSWLKMSCVYLFGVGMGELIIDTGKYMIGRLRPHFMAVCVPDFACNGTLNEGYITDYTCLGTDVNAIYEARKSFPSGHAAHSFYAAVFLIMYLQYVFTWNGSRLLRHVLQCMFLIAAWFTALSRVSDNHHHWSDVLAGILIGTLTALLNGNSIGSPVIASLLENMANPAIFMVADLLISSILLVTIFLLYFLAVPHQRGFYCADESITYPYVTPTLNDIAVIVCLLLIPILMFGIIEVITSEGKEPLFGNVQISKGILRWFEVTSTYLFGAGLSEITCDSAKYIVGRLRPHFIDVCQPDVKCDLNAMILNKYITEYTCLGPDVDRINEARLSFPSGFSAFAFYAAVYCIIYLQYNYKWNSAKVIRHLLQFAIMMAAWFMALSRISDHSAHWSDVVAGIAIGTTCATLTVAFVSDLHKNSKVRKEEEENRRQNLKDFD